MSFKEYASKEYVDNIYLKKEEIPRLIHDYFFLRDRSTGVEYTVYIEDGVLTTSCKIAKITVTTLPNKTSYFRGDVLDTTGMVVTAILENGNETVLDSSKVEHVNVLSNTVEIKYKDEFIENEFYITTIEVEMSEFDPAVVLIDFDYVEEENGTYTLTGWKQTLNGEPSTELIIPDNSLINL